MPQKEFTPKQIADHLSGAFKIKLDESDIVRLFEMDGYLVVLAPLGKSLDDGENVFYVVPNRTEVLKLTEGRNLVNADVISAFRLRYPMPLLSVDVGDFHSTDRLYVETGLGSFLVDTGAPNTMMFVDRDLTPDEAAGLVEVTRFQQMVSSTLPVYQAQIALKLTFNGDAVVAKTGAKLFSKQLFKHFHEKESGSVGILGMDVLKRCDLVWLSVGLLLVPNPIGRRAFQ